MFKLTEKQLDIINSDARIKLIMGSARSGKTLVTIKTLEREMKKLNSRGTKVLISEPTEAFAKEIMRTIMFTMKDMMCVVWDNRFQVDTIYGRIEVKCLLDINEIERSYYDIVVIDHATKNKFFGELLYRYAYDVYGIQNNDCTKLIVSGHCPKDFENPFYKTWRSAFHSSIKDTEAFKLRTWDNPALAYKKAELEKELMSCMSLENYIRDYYATLI